MQPEIINAVSVDVEEHFQVSAFESSVARTDWSKHASRVEANTDRLLELFQRQSVHGTFFILGWIGERFPELVKRIHDAGHEIASHGYAHRLVYDQQPEEFRDEVMRTKAILESAAPCTVRGYRAASFSITRRNLWALDVLVESGIEYDSSLFPIHHDRYGIPGAPRRVYTARTPNGSQLLEFPPSTVKVAGYTMPVAGGGYLRIFPFGVTRWAVKRLNQEGMPANVYLHPWEVDPEQPRIQVPFKSRLRHYTNLAKTESRLEQLLTDHRFGTCYEAVKQQEALGVATVELSESRTNSQDAGRAA